MSHVSVTVHNETELELNPLAALVTSSITLLWVSCDSKWNGKNPTN